MEDFGRYSISVQGTSVYKVLEDKNIVEYFKILFALPDPQDLPLPDDLLEHMWPLRHLDYPSGHTVWMSRHVK